MIGPTLSGQGGTPSAAFRPIRRLLARLLACLRGRSPHLPARTASGPAYREARWREAHGHLLDQLAEMSITAPAPVATGDPAWLIVRTEDGPRPVDADAFHACLRDGLIQPSGRPTRAGWAVRAAWRAARRPDVEG